MSAALVTEGDEAVGWSAWPWDPYYTPVAGAFVSGRLVAFGPCRLARPRLPAPAAPPEGRWRRALRRLAPAEALPAEGPEIALEGPDARCWFRFALEPETAERFRRGDPAVRLERLEDGARIPLARDDGTPPPTQAPLAVEALLDPAPARAPRPRDGFLAFLANPPRHQLQAVFAEYLRRLPEPLACDAYLPALEAGESDILRVRDEAMASEEFGRRRVGYGAHLGSAFTSPIWRRLATLPTPGPALRPVPRFDLAGQDASPDAEFLDALASALRRPPFERVETLASPQARRAFAHAQLRDAACRGVYLEVV